MPSRYAFIYLQETNNVKGDVMPNSLIIYLW